MALTPEERLARKALYMRRYRERNLEKLKPLVRARGRAYWQKNKERIMEQRKEKPRTDKDRAYMREYVRRYNKKYPERVKETQRKYNAKNPRRSLDLKLKKQEAIAGRPRPDICEICGNGNRDRALAFDHCHKTGKFRGWICGDCNIMLGLANDDPERLQLLINYLRSTL